MLRGALADVHKAKLARASAQTFAKYERESQLVDSSTGAPATPVDAPGKVSLWDKVKKDLTDRNGVITKLAAEAKFQASGGLAPYTISATSMLVMRQMLCVISKLNQYVQELAGKMESVDSRDARKATEAKILEGLSTMRVKMDQALQARSPPRPALWCTRVA